MKFNRWTKYPGGVYDNRPTKVLPPIERHVADGFNLRFADEVTLDNCSVAWGLNSDGAFQSAVAANDVTGLKIRQFRGESNVHPLSQPSGE